jgi:hypothetical protein
VRRLVLALGLSLGVAAPAAAPPAASSPAASSHGPSTSVASPTPSSTGVPAADCADLVALLPADLGDGLELRATPTTGVEGIDPDDLLDPFLASVGASRADVCGVDLRAGDETAGSAALVLRVRATLPDLADTFAAALAERLRGYGQTVAEDRSDVGGRPVHRLSVTASGATTMVLVAAATPDSVLVTSSDDLLEALLPWLPGAPEPSASAGTTPAGGPIASPAASVSESPDARQG